MFYRNFSRFVFRLSRLKIFCPNGIFRGKPHTQTIEAHIQLPAGFRLTSRKYTIIFTPSLATTSPKCIPILSLCLAGWYFGSNFGVGETANLPSVRSSGTHKLLSSASRQGSQKMSAFARDAISETKLLDEQIMLISSNLRCDGGEWVLACH